MKWLRAESYHIPTVLAVGLHVGVLFVGFVAFDFSNKSTPEPIRPMVVNATVVDVSQTIIGKREAEQRAAEQAAINEQRRREAQQRAENERRAQENRQREAARERQRQVAEAARQREIENQRRQQRIEQERNAKQAEEKRLAERQLAERRQAEQQRKEELARQEEANRQARQERQRQEEATRLAQEQQRKEQEARLAEELQAAELRAQAAAEEERKRAVEEAQMVQSISGLINSRVTAVWNRPPNARNNMRTQLRIYFLPNGEVMNVEVIQGSGYALFDSRAVDAVYRVGRIEELSRIDSYVFERNFRQIDLIFNPQDLRN